MANFDCESCSTLKEIDPSLMMNGYGDSEDASMQNDSGLVPGNGRTDCQDLELMNDCLIGNELEELKRVDQCDWKPFTEGLIQNMWTMFRGFGSAVCGIWTNIHSLWRYARSYRLSKDGDTIKLTAEDGSHGEVTDSDTTYTLTKSGSTITLTGSDGTTNDVADSDTKYGLSINGHTISIVEGGSTQQVTVPDNNTTYTLSISGHTITLTPNGGGTPMSVTVPDANTTYTLTKSGDTITLTDSNGNTWDVSDTDTWQPNTRTQNGYVTSGNGHASQVWMTDANGNPAWRDINLDDITDRLSELCALLDQSLSPALTTYGTLPLAASADNRCGTVTSTVIQKPDDGTLNPYTKTSQNVGIRYAQMTREACTSGQTEMLEWIMPDTFLYELASGASANDCLWKITKSEAQSKMGMSDWLWTTFTQSNWTWNETKLTPSRQIAWLQIGIGIHGLSANEMGVFFLGCTAPNDPITTDQTMNPISTSSARLYRHTL